MKVSIDFDRTLTREDVQSFAKELVQEGHEVWIVTSRIDDDTALDNNYHWIIPQNKKLYEIAKECGIENIKFTCMDYKSHFLKGKSFSFHLDDEQLELDEFDNIKCDCQGINVNYPMWKELCKQILNVSN